MVQPEIHYLHEFALILGRQLELKLLKLVENDDETVNLPSVNRTHSQ